MPSRVLITGATGFIGSSLCQWLAEQGESDLVAFTHTTPLPTSATDPRMETVRGDLLDPADVRRALRDCDAVVHLAHGDDRKAATVTSNLVEGSIAMGVRRFVHISSMSVHGPAPDATATSEDTATISRYNESYCDAKAEEEEIVQRAIAADRLSAVILRPTVVYGPRSPFVKQIVAEAKTGTVTVFDEGSGVCNAVCVDDVCAAIGAALIRDEALGQAMFINADRAVTWRDFINAFSQCVHPEPRVENLSSSAALQWWAAHPPAGSQGSGGVLGRVRSKVAAIAAARGPAPEFPPLGRVMRETVSVEFSNARAKNLLAWSPAVSFSQGVIATRQWLEASNLLD